MTRRKPWCVQTFDTEINCASRDDTGQDMEVVLLRAAVASCKRLIHLAIHCGGYHFFNDEASAAAAPAPSAYKSANNRTPPPPPPAPARARGLLCR